MGKLPNDFQRNLSKLLSRVELGEEIIILNQLGDRQVDFDSSLI